jgi:hypothetical protein
MNKVLVKGFLTCVIDYIKGGGLETHFYESHGCQSSNKAYSGKYFLGSC